MTVISNLEPTVEDMERKLDAALDGYADGNVILFADMYGSSCAVAGARLTRDRANVAVLCGVNLPMMVRFLAYRRRKTFKELVEFMRETGRSEVKSFPD